MPPERPSLDLSDFPKAKERDMFFGDMLEQIPMVEEESLQADMGGDACCIDAKNKWIEGLRDIFGADERHGGDLQYSLPGIENMHTHPYLSANAEIYRHYEEMSCEEFRDAIEQFAGGRPGKLYDANVKRSRGAPPTSEHYLAKRILEEWDLCEAKSTFGDNMDIYASADAFEAAWDYLAPDHRAKSCTWHIGGEFT